MTLLRYLTNFIFLKLILLTQLDLDRAISYLENRIINEQSNKEVKFRYFPLRYNKIEGIFNSYIHVNFVNVEKNTKMDSVLRTNLKCLDMNMFVTNFVLKILQEVNELGEISLKEEIFLKGFKGLLQFRDKNFDNLPIYTFWRQIKSKSKYWMQNPDSMVGLLDKKPNTNSLIKFLKLIGLNNFAKFLEEFNSLWNSFSYAYKIPADLDDTFTALALTSSLSKYNNTNFNKEWIEKNSNFSNLFNTIKKYSYKPFSKEEPLNPLDPRTYFWIHNFIMKKKAEGRYNLTIPTTWIWDLNTTKDSNDYVLIPFKVNNIDMNVISNFLYGITNFILFRPQNKSLIDQEMIEMIKDVKDLIYYVIENDIVCNRGDLSILYYPSKWDFFWMISRTLNLVKNELILSKKTNFDVYEKLLIEIFNDIEKLFEEKTLIYFKKNIKEENDEVFITEFLGNYANKTRNEDALFSTSLAFNTLINIFTYSENRKYYYDSNISSELKIIINKMKNFLYKKSQKYNSSREGVFFSGSVKGMSSFPYFYPADYFKDLNGTSLEPNNSTQLNANSIIGVYKYIDDNDFKELINQKHYGKNTPLKEDPYETSVFPYWSSPAMTDSLILLSLSKYKNIVEK